MKLQACERNTNMKKLIALILSVTTLTSCSNVGTLPKSDESIPKDTSSAVRTEELSAGSNGYKTIEIELPPDYGYINKFITFPGSDKFYMQRSWCNNDECPDPNSPTGMIEVPNYFESIDECKDLIFKQPDEFYSADYAVSDILFNTDGSFITMIVMEDHGGMKLPDEYDESFDYTTYNSNCTYSFKLIKYSGSCEVLWETDFEAAEYLCEESEDQVYLSYGSTIADGDSILVSTYSGKIFRISQNGEISQVFALESDPYEISAPVLARDRDGKLILAITEETVDDNGFVNHCTSLCDFGENGHVEEPFTTFSNDNIEGFHITPGSGEYRLYISHVDGLYGITNSGDEKLIIDYEDISLESGLVISLGDNVFLTAVDDDQFVNTHLYKIVPREPGEIDERTEISIANPYNYIPRELINNFNKSQDKYKIKTIEFEQSDEELSQGSLNNNALNMALIQGEAPDIIYGLDFATFQNYQNKGVFTDLYPLMENDPKINKSTILPNFLKAMESSDGSLYTLCDSFGVSTMVAKTKVFSKENWTFDEMAELYENPPVNAVHRYDGYNKEEMFNNLIYCFEDLIDYETATCNFHSEEFIKLLEFCNRFVDVVPKPDKSADGNEANQNYWTDRFTWLKKDEILNDTISPLGYSLCKYLQGGGEELTIVGYPSPNGKGGRLSVETLISITESCKCKEGAWAFISYCIEQSNLSNANSDTGLSGLPIISESFEKLMDNEMTANHTASGMEIPNLTQADRDMLADYIKSCDTLCTLFDEDVQAVCEEETALYFAGQQTAETTAEHIQNRASIIISEKN